MPIGRVGHTACYYKDHNAVYIFGGQQERSGNANMNLRDMQNDLWRFSLSSGNASKIYVQNLSQLSRRMFMCSFIVSQFFFNIGGVSASGEIIPEIVMIDLEKNVCKPITKETNKTMRLLKPLSSMSCVGAFYSSRYSSDGIELDLD